MGLKKFQIGVVRRREAVSVPLEFERSLPGCACASAERPGVGPAGRFHVAVGPRDHPTPVVVAAWEHEKFRCFLDAEKRPADTLRMDVGENDQAAWGRELQLGGLVKLPEIIGRVPSSLLVGSAEKPVPAVTADFCEAAGAKPKLVAIGGTMVNLRRREVCRKLRKTPVGQEEIVRRVSGVSPMIVIPLDPHRALRLSAAARITVLSNPLAIILGIHDPSQDEGALVRAAISAPSLLFGLSQQGKKKPSQHGGDGDDSQKFDQCESIFPSAWKSATPTDTGIDSIFFIRCMARSE